MASILSRIDIHGLRECTCAIGLSWPGYSHGIAKRYEKRMTGGELLRNQQRQSLGIGGCEGKSPNCEDILFYTEQFTSSKGKLGCVR